MADAATATKDPNPMPASMRRAPATVPVPKGTMDAAPAQSKAPAAEIPGERKSVQWLQIEKSALNPRKHFDEDRIATLAESIAIDGVIQNLIVRPHPKIKITGSAGTAGLPVYEIVSGENRWRAIEHLIKQGRTVSGFQVPVLIRTLTDAQLIETALAENMQRKDLTPLEEAEGLKALRATLSTEEIAKRIGFTQRYVQQRLALVDNLAPEAKKALAAGNLKIEHARILSAAPMARQVKIIEEMEDGYIADDPEAVRDLVKEHQIPDKFAAFDLVLYKGAWLPGENDGERFFADIAQFETLQRAAVKKTADDLKAKGATWVKTVARFNEHEFNKKPSATNAGAVIELRGDGKVTVHKGLVEKPRQRVTSHATSAPQRSAADDNIGQTHREYAAARRSFAMQAVVAADSSIALKIILAEIVTDGGFDGFEMAYRQPIAEARLKELRSLFSKYPQIGAGIKMSAERFDPPNAYSTDNKAEKKAKAVFALSDVAVTKLLGALIAALVHDDMHHRVGPRVATILTADMLGIAGKEEKFGLALQADDLEGLSDKVIRAIARDLGIDQWKLRPATALKKDITTAIDAGKAKTYVLPTMRFAENTEKAIETLIKGVDDAAPAKAVAKKPAKKAKK